LAGRLEAHVVTSVRRNREFWERAVREVERGAAVSAVAQRLAVRPGTLSWWRWHLQKESGTSPPVQRPRPRRSAKAEFLPVVVAGSTPTGRVGLVEIDVGNARVRVEVGVDVSYVAALVQALRSAC
jgi:transposase-like protein